MKKLFFVIVGLWLSSPVLAQDIPVQTGEHAGFTRVVLQVPRQATWKVGRVENGYGVHIQGGKGFDLTTFFDLIPKDRILDVDVIENETLSLMVSCDCHVVTFEDRPGVLVVDVTDGPAEPESESETALFPEIVIPPEKVVEMSPLSFDLIPLPLSASQNQNETALQSAEEFARLADERADIDDLESRIAQSLARAASQGLVELNSGNDVAHSEDQIEP